MAIQFQNKTRVDYGSNAIPTFKIEYVVDTASEISSIPTTPVAVQGSMAYCIATKEFYIKNGSNAWVLMFKLP